MPPRILIVDDSAEERGLLLSLLEDAGFHRVMSAASGEEALRHVVPGALDLLVTDYVMPGLDGLQLTRRAIEIDPGLQGRVLIVTGGMYGREDALAFASGTSVLIKPFALGQFITTVESLLSRPRLQEA